MAAAAYSAIVSLMHVLDNLQHPTRKQLCFDRNQIETLREKVSFLLDFLEDYSEVLCNTDREELARQIAHVADEAEEVIDYHVVEQLRRQLADVADEAEHVIDSHVVDQLSQRFADKADMGLPSFSEDMDTVLNKMESIKRELMMVKDQGRPIKELQPRVSVPDAGSSAPPSSGNINTMVGFDKHLDRIMAKLRGDESNLQIVPIVGMGGIGKTTLARNAYDNRSTMDHFDVCTWFTISQSYSIQDVLLGLLGELDHQKNKESNQNLAELGERLHKRLFARRYMIVMDDVWSTNIWDELRTFFPENRNGSRIIVTTRLFDVAKSLGNHNSYVMDFLDEKNSWKLLCEKAFGKEVCPYPELEKIGKSIAQSCKGLPLAIVVLGGLLAKLNKIREDWELVSKDVMKSLDNSKDDEDCSKILSLSYKHLPIHLKPCFLYMRVFREDEEIDVGTLVEYWLAEGFVKSKGGKNLEEVAREYLKDLIDRNLILIHKSFPLGGEVTECKVHDLLRELCFKEYEKEHVFRISKVQDTVINSNTFTRDTCFLCRYRKASTMINLPTILFYFSQPSLVSCFVCDVCTIMCSQRNRLRLVKIADSRYTYPNVEILYPTRLRYLKVTKKCPLLHTSLTLMWNLQSLYICTSRQLPFEIWEMPKLRHLTTTYGAFPPVTQLDRKDSVILENLQSIENVSYFRCSEEIVKRIPNVKKLDLTHTDSLNNLVDLHKLETLFLRYTRINLEDISFPNSLKRLHLFDCNYPWERMTIIGSLPNLEIVELHSTHGGPEWNPVEGDFLRLTFLAIGRHDDLVRWNAEKDHFPKLEILNLWDMKCLEKIPSSIGDIDTLCRIELHGCTESVVNSANEIIEEQRSYGNEDLQLVLD